MSPPSTSLEMAPRSRITSTLSGTRSQRLAVAAMMIAPRRAKYTSTLGRRARTNIWRRVKFRSAAWVVE